MSLTEADRVEHCALCGKPGANKPEPGFDEAILCEDCIEERFAELYKAAQVLLREGIAEEDLIYPTLAYANELGLGTVAYCANEQGREILDLDEEAGMLVSSAKNNADWEKVVERFRSRHVGMVPVRVVDGVVILRWLAVDGIMHYYPIPEAKIPQKVTIRILPHIGSLDPGRIASAYESILNAHDVNYGRSGIGSIDFEDAEGELLVTTYASTPKASRIPPEHAAVIFSDRNPEFVHPDLMAALCQGLLRHVKGHGKDRVVHGFDRWLNRRKAGGPRRRTLEDATMSAARSIRACVAFFLNRRGLLPQGMTAHRLLNKHVLPLPDGIATIPEEDCSTSESTALWKAANTAGVMLSAMSSAIYDPEYRA